jgi:plasmid stabilization system protein ParE
MTPIRFEVFWAEAAIRDLEEIVDFIEREAAPMAAQRLFNRMKRRSATLESLPARGRIVPELARHDIKIYRELILPPHRLIYRIEAHRVLVVAVFDGRRDLEDVLLARLMRP